MRPGLQLRSFAASMLSATPAMRSWAVPLGQGSSGATSPPENPSRRRFACLPGNECGTASSRASTAASGTACSMRYCSHPCPLPWRAWPDGVPITMAAGCTGNLTGKRQTSLHQPSHHDGHRRGVTRKAPLHQSSYQPPIRANQRRKRTRCWTKPGSKVACFELPLLNDKKPYPLG